MMQVRGMDSSMLDTALEVQRLRRRSGNLLLVLQHLQVCCAGPHPCTRLALRLWTTRHTCRSVLVAQCSAR